MNLENLFRKGRTAIITGGANGIGLATAKRLAARGMSVCIADIDAAQLARAGAELEAFDAECLCVQTDVSDFDSVAALRETAQARFDDIALVMNNAGIGAGGGAFTNLDGWRKVLSVNLWGVIHGVHAFVPMLIEQGRPAVVINTGSKQGITNPPGNAAYNVAKAGVRSLTESLAHELRNLDNCQVSAHLLVPGFTYTGLIRKHISEKPDAAWTPEQVADYMLERLANDDFYILCPDNDVSVELDYKRIEWNTQDIVQNRPALSRWHPDYADAFESFIQDKIQNKIQDRP